MNPLSLLVYGVPLVVGVFLVNVPYLALVYKFHHGHTPIPESHGEGSEPLSTRDYWLRCVIGAAWLTLLQAFQIGLYLAAPFIFAGLGLDGSVAFFVGVVVVPILYILLLALHVWLFMRVFDLEDFVKGFGFFWMYYGLPYIALILTFILTGGFASLMK